MFENKNRTRMPLMYIIDPLINERDQPQEQKEILMKKKLKPSPLEEEEYTLIEADHVTNLQKGMVIVLNLEDKDSDLQNEVFLNKNESLMTKGIDMTLMKTRRHEKEGKEKLQEDMVLNTMERAAFDYQETRHNHEEAAEVKNEEQNTSVIQGFGKRDHPSRDSGFESLEVDPFNPMFGIDLFHFMHKEDPAFPLGTAPLENLEGTEYEGVTDNYKQSEISDYLDNELDLVEENEIEELSSLLEGTEETELKSTEDGSQEVKVESSEAEERIESTLAAKKGGNFQLESAKEDVTVLESLSHHEEAKEIEDVNQIEAEASTGIEEEEPVFSDIHQGEVAETEAFPEETGELKRQGIDEVSQNLVEAIGEAEAVESVLPELQQEEGYVSEPLASSDNGETDIQNIKEISGVKELEGEEGIVSKDFSKEIEVLQDQYRGCSAKQQYKAEKGRMDSAEELLKEAEKGENGNRLNHKKKAHVKVPTEKLLLRTMRAVRSDSFKNKTVLEKIEYMTALPKHVTRVFVEVKTNKKFFFGVICAYSREQESLTIISRNTLKLHTLEIKEIQNIKIISL
ncbi:hypothetical protein J9317_03805 [Metabacillus sp. KIGAM252]|uniref:Spore coat protein CotO n=1 Tax=Metabacillus flavus TaxID=2823519 RepID=A0ABS5LAZ5_9BACI|nr:CotO family spore coat protein [Metabacillus flavus]MBS2967900.1 hypothetical protein [Metabacillus flavus]